MSKLEDAMLKHIQNIVNNEYRPFSFKDLLYFEHDGQYYNPKRGTIRNKLSKFSKEGKIELCYIDALAFYSLPGKKFGKDKLMTDNHTEVINTQKLIHQPLYQILESTTFGERTVHNLHSCFKAMGIYNVINNLKLDEQHFHNSKGISFTYFIDQFT